MSTPSEIARYSMTYIAGQGIPALLDAQGVWVKHTDHLAARAADAAEIDRLKALCRELWESRRSMAYGPNGERVMLEQYPWLQERP